MLILGINAYHGDAAAALVKDGKVVFAAEEERYRRIKHWAGLPTESVRACLKSVGSNLDDVDIIAVNQDARSNLNKKLAFVVKSRPDLALLANRVLNRKKVRSIPDEISAALGQTFKGKVVNVEHHLAHLASAFYCSPFKHAIAVSVDGFGDFASTAWATGIEKKIESKGRIFFPHSLGIFYQAITQYLGFQNYGDEYKVMGLAPYGQPRYLEQMREIVRINGDGSFSLNLSYFRHHTEKLDYTWDGGEPHVDSLYSDDLSTLLGVPSRKTEELTQVHCDVAHSAQRMYEEALFALLNAIYERHSIPALVLAGGCAQNSVANGKVHQHTPFKELYVQSAAGDAGGALGAAALVWYQMGNARPGDCRMKHAYLGDEFDNKYIEKMLREQRQNLENANCSSEYIQDEERLIEFTAESIANGAVVGWFQGRMEWGPRALGSRSILGDPRRSDMKELLNRKIKRRESFRPFAPSILRECVGDWFESDADVPFMMQVYSIKPEKRHLIPAVAHVDGSGRLQTVDKESNPRYYKLISTFASRTNVPMLLNTSFNENEPVVCKPEEALSCFLRTKMDVLVVGEFVVKRHGSRTS